MPSTLPYTTSALSFLNIRTVTPALLLDLIVNLVLLVVAQVVIAAHPAEGLHHLTIVLIRVEDLLLKLSKSLFPMRSSVLVS